MTRPEAAFLDLVRAALRGTEPDDPALSAGEWETVFRLADRHKLLPLALDATVPVPSFRAACRAGGSAAASSPPEQAAPSRATNPSPVPFDGRAWQERAMEQISGQVFQEIDFLNAALALKARGLEPLCLKGPVCRALYPKPLLRPSVDDDLLIPEADGAACHAALLDLGLTPDEPAADPASAWELSYHKPGSRLYVEVHKRLFDPESPVFGPFNEAFAGALDRAVALRVQDVELRTLAPTDHLLFLILHAFKHFLHSGFGLRVAADICLFARANPEADLDRVRAVCAAHRCEGFLAAVLTVGEKYLGVPRPAAFAGAEVDEGPLLADILAAGLHGTEADRIHSAPITLGAAEDQALGRRRDGPLTKALFPGVKTLSGRYPYLQKHPWLLPAAWVSRGAAYWKAGRLHGKRRQSPAASLRIGKERVALLETYGIIDP